jgi:hypothetical protein
MRVRRAILADARAVAQSPLFDAAWYRASNQDVCASGLDPALHYAIFGGKENRNPSLRFSTARYLACHPEAIALGRPALLHFIEEGVDGDWSPQLSPSQTEELAPISEPSTTAAAQLVQEVAAGKDIPTLGALLRERFAGLEPLRTYSAPHDKPRVSIVTDSINAESLHGGGGTALLLAILLAERLGTGLRLVTRTEPPDLGDIGAVLAANLISWDNNIELVYAPSIQGYDVSVAPNDIFLTTSWSTTLATRRAVHPTRIVYVLQEDERGLYPHGDDHLRCTETLSDPSLLYVVSSSLLMSHLQADGLALGGIAFEPVFPNPVYDPGGRHSTHDRRGFFFDASRHDLYWRGLEAVGAAIEEGVLDPAIWDIHFVGTLAQAMILPGGTRPTVIQNLPSVDYTRLVRQMGVGLSLRKTSFPSYVSLDLAASGAVVVTNGFGIETSSLPYSANILTVEPTVSGLVNGLRQAVALTADPASRSANSFSRKVSPDWQEAFAPILDRLASRFGP